MTDVWIKDKEYGRLTASHEPDGSVVLPYLQQCFMQEVQLARANPNQIFFLFSPSGPRKGAK